MIVGIKSGTFMLLTKGHVECLEFCKTYCDYLIVVVNHDDYLIRKKGFCAVPLNERMRVLESIKYVDCVIAYGEDSEQQIVKQICNDWRGEYEDASESLNVTIFHALETHNKDFVPGRGIVDSIIFCPNVKSSSTSDIMNITWAGIDDNIEKVERP